MPRIVTPVGSLKRLSGLRSPALSSPYVSSLAICPLRVLASLEQGSVVAEFTPHSLGAEVAGWSAGRVVLAVRAP